MDLKELQERQSWPLAQKIDHSLFTIETFLSRTEGKAYVAFSGGKDSTVLLDLVRIIDKDIPAVFVNTGNEYPDIIKFVRHLRDDKGYNIVELHPKMTPREVWAKYGFPLVSKSCSQGVHEYRHCGDKEVWLKRHNEAKQKGGAFAIVSSKWEYLFNEPYEVSHLCCKILKKDTLHKYESETERRAIIGTMASESKLRAQTYVKRGGCNSFGEKSGIISSTPIAIWTEDDIWCYINERSLEICKVYYMGIKRTGCVGCGFGCQFDNTPHRFDLLFQLYPKYYEMVMNYTNNGVTYRDAVRKVMATHHLELPDESGKLFFPID